MTKVACITGVTSGIGKAIKTKLEANGWKVVGFARHLPLEDVGYEVDLSRLEAAEPVATRAGEEHGPIDAFIHVAGVWHDADHVLAGKRLDEFTTEEIVKTMNVGLTSAMILSAKLLPFSSDGASFVYISGTFQDSGESWLPYYTSKRGLEDFISGLSVDQPTKKIYAVSPSDTATESYKKFYPEYASNAQSPEQVASVCVGLINGELNYQSGSVVKVVNGQHSAQFHA